MYSSHLSSSKNCGYEQKMNETFIINLMAAWLEDCRVFSITISTAVFIYSILIFIYLLLCSLL